MARTGLPDPQCGAPSLCFRFNPDSSGGGWGTGKDATLQVTVLNLTVSIQCPSNDRHHSRQALGIQRHTGHPMDYVLVTLYMGVRGGHRKLTTGRTPEGCLAPWGCWDRFLNTLPHSALGPWCEYSHEERGQQRHLGPIPREKPINWMESKTAL